MWLWQSAPPNSSRPWSSCLLPSACQIHLITAPARRNGAGCWCGALGGSTLSVAGCRMPEWRFLSEGSCWRHTEHASLLFACNIIHSAGYSITAVIMQTMQHSILCYPPCSLAIYRSKLVRHNRPGYLAGFSFGISGLCHCKLHGDSKYYNLSSSRTLCIGYTPGGCHWKPLGNSYMLYSAGEYNQMYICKTNPSCSYRKRRNCVKKKRTWESCLDLGGFRHWPFGKNAAPNINAGRVSWQEMSDTIWWSLSKRGFQILTSNLNMRPWRTNLECLMVQYALTILSVWLVHVFRPDCGEVLAENGNASVQIQFKIIDAHRINFSCPAFTKLKQRISLSHFKMLDPLSQSSNILTVIPQSFTNLGFHWEATCHIQTASATH